MANFDDDQIQRKNDFFSIFLGLDNEESKTRIGPEKFTGQEEEVTESIVENEPVESPRIALGKVTIKGKREAPRKDELIQRRGEIDERKREALKAKFGRQQTNLAEELKLHDQIAQDDREFAEGAAKRQALIDKELTDTWSSIQAERTELSQKEPKGFWAKADTSDKLLMGLSVMIGAIGQGISQSRSNAALVMMGKVMDDDLAQQNADIDRKIKLLDKRGLDANTKASMQTKLLNSKLAHKKAASDHMRSMIERIKISAKGPEAKAELDNALIDLDESLLAEDQEDQEMLIQDITTSFDAPIDLETGEISNVATQSFEQLPKEQEKAVGTITQASANLIPIQNELAAALDVLNDPNKSEEEKMQTGQNLVKTMNSTQGSDAVGADEARRLAQELEGNIGDIASAAGKSGAGGAALGGIVPAIGPIAGGTIGFIGGGLITAIEKASQPGGIRLGPDIESFTQRTTLVAEKLKATLKRNELTIKFMKKGMTPFKASQMAEKQLQKQYSKGK